MKKTRTIKPRSTVALVPRVIKRRFPHVTKCLDAQTPIEIDVTEDDGGGGVSADFEQCALARAACRQQHADHAIVSKRVVYTIKGNIATRYAVNERIRQEIASFDRHHDFAPGQYVLRPNRPSDRLGARSAYHRPDPRPRHDVTRPRWVPSPRVRDLNVADAVVVTPTKTRRRRA